jgi:hypothetical protein
MSGRWLGILGAVPLTTLLAAVMLRRGARGCERAILQNSYRLAMANSGVGAGIIPLR